jgi:hypothetical protein
VELEELRARAKERLRQLAAQPNDGLDAFQKDVLAFFARVPEPPLYRRRDDPTRAVATALLDEAELLLARSWRLGAEVGDFTHAIEGHFVALALMSQGKVELAEPAWHDALARERTATAPLRLWTRTDEQRPTVFDAGTGRSRFDPRPEAQVEAKLVCPACRKVSQFSLSPRVASHRLQCTHCVREFIAYVAELRVLEVQPLGRNRRRYRFRVEELSGLQTVVEFDDATQGELGAVRRDLLAFLYTTTHELRGVLNLNSSRVLWVSPPGACFVATVAFGEGAPELDALRGFRDRVLTRSGAGRAFIEWYYREGPALAREVQARPRLRALTRGALKAVVPWLERVP